jgi:hypothetical protein
VRSRSCEEKKEEFAWGKSRELVRSETVRRERLPICDVNAPFVRPFDRGPNADEREICVAAKESRRKTDRSHEMVGTRYCHATAPCDFSNVLRSDIVIHGRRRCSIRWQFEQIRAISAALVFEPGRSSLTGVVWCASIALGGNNQRMSGPQLDTRATWPVSPRLRHYFIP